MKNFRQMADAPAGSRLVLQGNRAFALGVVHAGFHAADGYPGTPSTEVIDRSLAQVQDRMVVGWDVNEAVAVAVGVGHAVAGFDTVVTMKTPGVFQAGDAVTTSAFYHAPAGALVWFVASDYVPSSTQHVIDLKHLFSSSRLPVLEPRDHQDLYDFAAIAADMSRNFHTPVVILANGILCHSEGMIHTRKPRTISPRELPPDLKGWMGLPILARRNYDMATAERMPAIEKWMEGTELIRSSPGRDSWGIITSGESTIMVREALDAAGVNPHILSLACPVPFPSEPVRRFAGGVEGPIFVIEDGDQFIEERCLLAGIPVTGKAELLTRTEWTPGLILQYLAGQGVLHYDSPENLPSLKPVARPPSICPGCPYRAFGLAVAELKRKGKLDASFGDIGCSTLLYFMDAVDTCMCMGASDSMRQGFVLSRPELAHRVISVLGDSCECHSGLDSTRNAVFRGTPGVKVILDNRITAMTGGQPAPSSGKNLAGKKIPFSLHDAVAAEKAHTVVINSYDLKAVAEGLKAALMEAENGTFSCLILQGACIHQVSAESRRPTLRINREKCRRCGQCNICPGIELDGENSPHFTPLCSNCGGATPVCLQRCPFGAIEVVETETAEQKIHSATDQGRDEAEPLDETALPPSMRVAIRGVGGQGNLFFGRVLAGVAERTPYADTHIVKGDTHGMAQLGGAVISTFGCGQVHSPVFAPATADVLVAMEAGEVLRPDFMGLLKPGGIVLLNRFRALPPGVTAGDYPEYEEIIQALDGFHVIPLDAQGIAAEAGDSSGRSANVVALGLLSTQPPFNLIPGDRWLTALGEMTADPRIRAVNAKAFSLGRKLGEGRGDQ